MPQEKRNSLERGAVVEELFDVPQEVKVEGKRTSGIANIIQHISFCFF